MNWVLILMIPAREEQVFAKLEDLNRGPLSKDSLRIIYREVISASIALEKKLIIGYLGPEATYTHQAAVNNFGSILEYRPITIFPMYFKQWKRQNVTMESFQLKILLKVQ
jgi:chorismate mutase/prephenate dehydratase